MTTLSVNRGYPAIMTMEPVALALQIVFFFSSGLGDMSCNDCILEGVQKFKMEHKKIDIYICSPRSLLEAEKKSSPTGSNDRKAKFRVVCFGHSDYEPMAELHLAEHDLTLQQKYPALKAGNNIKREHSHTFQISISERFHASQEYVQNNVQR